MRSMLPSRLTIAKVAMVLAVMPIAVGCNCIFNAAFNSDTVGNPPDTTLPGYPTGDALSLNTPAGEILVRASVGDLTNQPVEVRMTGGTGGVDLLGTVAGTPPTTGKWVASWRGLVQANSGENIFGAMVFRDSGALILAAVEYRENGIIDFSELFTGTGIGVTWTPDVSQLFEVTIDLDAKTVSLSIDGVPVASCQNLNYKEAAAIDLARMNFEVGYTTPQAFALDNLMICAATQEDDHIPGTPYK